MDNKKELAMGEFKTEETASTNLVFAEEKEDPVAAAGEQ